ncbi:hypothetical protein COY28_02000 [Candidatus Woesearchaeota archaeon CG_4_10_14_0_2_um_filter_57_5]|nr:MAG: hypothetical protein AUJ68_05215 [Candidatus Woesearchaeota archaeon CG1_02_57_44]PIZ55319.1 MAG: hypothetical protein COY28_02000 [Candidatus Woesearchaeota archaeon CG_4_10_14_0_2_um_filter_57_5]
MVSSLLKGKRILVTGGSRGIGKAIMEFCASQGATVFFTYHQTLPDSSATADSKDAGRNQSTSPGHFPDSCPCDVRSEPDIQAAVAEATEYMGGLDVLVNSAGVLHKERIQELTQQGWQDSIDINLKGLVLMCKAAAPHLREAKGCVVNISSVSGIRGTWLGVSYAASKAGILAVTKSLARELAPEIRVNCVAPGPVETDMLDQFADNNAREYFRKRNQLKRIGEPLDVAKVVGFLASDLAGFMTGQTLVVDGGEVML